MSNFESSLHSALTRLIQAANFVWIAGFAFGLRPLIADIGSDNMTDIAEASSAFWKLAFWALFAWAMFRVYTHVWQPLIFLQSNTVTERNMPSILSDVIWMSSGPALAIWLCFSLSFSGIGWVWQTMAGAAAAGILTWYERKADDIAMVTAERAGLTLD